MPQNQFLQALDVSTQPMLKSIELLFENRTQELSGSI